MQFHEFILLRRPSSPLSTTLLLQQAPLSLRLGSKTCQLVAHSIFFALSFPLSVSSFFAAAFLSYLKLFALMATQTAKKARVREREREEEQRRENKTSEINGVSCAFFSSSSLSPPFLLPPATRQGRATRKIKTFSLHFPFPH